MHEPLIEKLKSAVSKWQGKRVLILGDMILDEFIFGRTQRVSREAPVVVVRYDGCSYSPGGAANAAQNVDALGGRADPIGLIGLDDTSLHLKRIFHAKGLPVRGLISSSERCTTSKTRVMAGDYHAQRQQIVRIDREQDAPISLKLQERVLSLFESRLKRADAVILSDYQQGLFTEKVVNESINMCRRSGIPVVADSRFRLGEFKGVTTATPNEVEAAAAAGFSLTGDRALERIARKLLRSLSASSLLVTRGRFGMCLFEPRRRVRSVEVVGSSEATDVTGAGDTVVSAVALTLAAGESMYTAMHIANMAASIVVMKRGTAVVKKVEVLELISKSQQPGRCSTD